MRDIPIAVAAALTCLIVGTAPVAMGATPSDRSASPDIGEQSDDDSALITTVETLDARTRDLTIESPAVGTAKVRLLLPTAFETRPDARFPVLYLLHGGGGGYDDWTRNTEVEAFTRASDVIVVMPASASSGLGTGVPDGGVTPPDWERFHLVELRTLLERDWRADDRRAIAGLSLGGYGAVMYAARHPELFDAVASYSGVLDIAVAPGESEEAQEIVEQVTTFAESAGWVEANPINLVPLLAGTAVYISYGDGEPGPLDSPDTGFDRLEAWVGAGGDNFGSALDEEGVPAELNDYGPGTHSWSYWDRELETSLPLLLESLGQPE
jgi:diacylglycerol O-acyltransferase/trehalose O-mycolyltransferase